MISKPMRISASVAASWAWAVSIVVGIAVVQERGWVPFTMWAAANALALPLFAFTVRRVPTMWRYLESRVVLIFMGALQVCSIWVNTQGVQMGLIWAGMPQHIAQPMAAVIALVFVGIIWFGGLRLSINTDVVQYGVMIAGSIAAIILSIMWPTGPRPEVAWVAGGMPDIMWGAWGAAGLLAGPLLDMQSWQRAELVRNEGFNVRRIYGVAGMMFGAYMVLVGVLGQAQESHLAGLALVAVILAVGTSTLDSAAAALQRVAGRHLGAAIGLGAVITWPLVHKWGIVTLWTLYASVRVFIVAGMVALALWDRRRTSVLKK